MSAVRTIGRWLLTAGLMLLALLVIAFGDAEDIQ